MIIPLNPREKTIVYELLRLKDVTTMGSLPYKTPWLEILAFPQGSLTVLIIGSTGIKVDVEISNVDRDDAGKKIATDLVATDTVALSQGARLARMVVTAGSAGSVGGNYSGALQS